VAAGQPFPDLLRAYVLDPAGLAETFFPAPATIHERIAQVRGALAFGTPGAMYNSSYALGLAHPAFGVVASARDLLRFGLLFAPAGRVRVHSEATIRAMTTDRTGGVTSHGGQRFYPFNSDAYGLGFVAGPHFGGTGDDLASPASFGHDGASGCVLLVDPTYDLTIALVSNRHMLSGLERWRFRLGALLDGVLAALTRREG
jgi:CubicO group peptidase (beta-lactamase class C family)